MLAYHARFIQSGERMSQISPTTPSISLAPQPISEEVLIEKYSKGTERTIADVNQRVARALAKVEAPEQQKLWEAKFLDTLEAGFLPAGRIQSAAGGTEFTGTATGGGGGFISIINE